MSTLKILHMSDAFLKTKPEEYEKVVLDYIYDSDADVIVFTGNMGFTEKPKTDTPTVYIEGDYEKIDYAIKEPKILYIGSIKVLTIPHSPEKDEDNYIKNICGEEIDIIISPAAPIDTHFLKGNRDYEVLFDVAYFRSPRIWLAGHYKFFPYYQAIVQAKNPKRKYTNVYGVNTSYGYIEEIIIDEKLNLREYSLKRIFNGHGRKIF